MAEASVLAAPGAHLADKSRRAIWAAAIGNLLEWYDFGVYGFLAVLIATNFFPGSDPTTAPAQVVCRLWRRLPGAAARRHHHRPARRHQGPQDGAGAHHLPDGVRHRGPRPVADLSVDRRLGADPARHHAPGARARRRWRMGHLDRLHDRMGAARPARLLRQLPAGLDRRRHAARLRCCRDHDLVGLSRSDARLGLARAVPARRGPARRRRLYAPERRRDAVL